MRLGIQHQRILPAHPQQNGAPERMHRTLKGEAIRPPRANLAAQQRGFHCFRRLYNEERAHQALHGKTPASLYRPSDRPYTGGLPPIEYPGHFIVKMVTNAGAIRFKKRLLFIANALKQHHIGLEETDDGIWSIHFCNVLFRRPSDRPSAPSPVGSVRPPPSAPPLRSATPSVAGRLAGSTPRPPSAASSPGPGFRWTVHWEHLL